MRIAMFHELHQGGARRSVNEFAKRLKKLHTVDLYIVDDKRNTSEDVHFTNVFFYRFVPKKWKGNNWKTKLYKDTIELIKLFHLHYRIAKAIDWKAYDVVFIEPSRFTQAPFLLTLLKSKKVYYCQEPLRMVYEPLLDTTYSMPFTRKMYERLNRAMRKAIDRRNIYYVDKILANSSYTQKNIKNAYGLKSTVQYMGVDTAIFYPEKVTKDIDVLYVGAYESVDGYSLIEDAKKYLKKKWNIVSLASEKQWISDDTALRQLYSRAKVILCLAHNEPFGLIPLEAMACEVPVIAVAEGGYLESVKHEKSGLLIKREPKKLAEALDFLLTNSKIRKQYGLFARTYVEEQWSWDKSAKFLATVLQRVSGV